MKEEKPKARLLQMPTPEAPPTIPAPPMELTGEALNHWKQHAEELAKRGLLDKFTASFFVLVCCGWQHYLKISEQVCKDGLTIRSSNGRQLMHPLLPEMNRSLKIYRLLARDMGMLPTKIRP
jgi:P27 family predicted phage terminase small subunit